MTSNYDRVLPSWYRPRDTLEDDRLAEDGTAKDVTDGTVGALPHLLELELLDTSLIGSDSGALDTDTVLQNGLSRFNSHFVIGLLVISC